jgi:hypothetical protein
LFSVNDKVFINNVVCAMGNGSDRCFNMDGFFGYGRLFVILANVYKNTNSNNDTDDDDDDDDDEKAVLGTTLYWRKTFFVHVTT